LPPENNPVNEYVVAVIVSYVQELQFWNVALYLIIYAYAPDTASQFNVASSKPTPVVTGLSGAVQGVNVVNV
jgi:hypothetical protein